MSESEKYKELEERIEFLEAALPTLRDSVKDYFKMNREALEDLMSIEEKQTELLKVLCDKVFGPEERPEVLS